MRIRMQGFIVFDFADKYAEARKQLAQWLSEGKLKRKETVIKGGITKAEDALVGLFEGKNTGKHVWSQLGSEVTNDYRQNHGTGGGPRSSQGKIVETRKTSNETSFTLQHAVLLEVNVRSAKAVELSLTFHAHQQKVDRVERVLLFICLMIKYKSSRIR
jgi:hypothetical protein